MLVNWKKNYLIERPSTHTVSKFLQLSFLMLSASRKEYNALLENREKVSHKKHPLSYAYVAGIHNRKIMHGINFFLSS
jgi:hypothetical protein